MSRLVGIDARAAVASLAAFAALAAPASAQRRLPMPAAAPAAPAPPASPAAPDLPRATFIATMDSQFRAQDPNGDGKLTRAEIEEAERVKLVAAAQAANRAQFARLDTDRNGQLSPAEFAAAMQQPNTPDVSQTMTRLDLNRDQVVTLVEYRAATLANFDRLDADHDGVVTGAEMAAGGVRPQGR